MPKAGYWRSSTTTDVFYECFNPDACEGYTTTNLNEMGGCLKGYYGIMCAECDVGYSRVGDNECAKCPNEVLNIIRIVGFLLLVFVIVALLVKTTIQGAGNKRNILAVYNRVMVNHVQILVIIYSFKLDWPNTFSSIFSSAEPAAEAPKQFISFDCFLDKRTSNDMDANALPLVYYRLIMMGGLPFVIILTSIIIWNFVFLYYKFKSHPEKELNKKKYNQKLQSQKEIRIAATNLIVLIFVHPSLLDVYFEMFN